MENDDDKNDNDADCGTVNAELPMKRKSEENSR